MSTMKMLVAGAVGALVLLAAGCQMSAEQRSNIEKDAALARERQEKTNLAAESETKSNQIEALRAKVLKDEEELAKLRGELAKPKDDPGEEGVSSVQRTESGLVITLAGSTLFASGDAALQKSAGSTLDRLIATLKKDFPGRYIRIEGHTDSTPVVHSKAKFGDNMGLSLARARSVYEYMVQHGLEAKKLNIAGYGDTQLLVKPEKSAADRAKNRRVDVVILPANVKIERKTLAAK